VNEITRPFTPRHGFLSHQVSRMSVTLFRQFRRNVYFSSLFRAIPLQAADFVGSHDATEEGQVETTRCGLDSYRMRAWMQLE